MVIEVIPEFIEGGLLATGVAGSGKLLLPVAGITGAITGLLTSDMKHAAIYSALAGAGLTVFHKGATTPSKLVMSMMTSTAIGAIAHYMKKSYVAQMDEQQQIQEILRG